MHIASATERSWIKYTAPSIFQEHFSLKYSFNLNVQLFRTPSLLHRDAKLRYLFKDAQKIVISSYVLGSSNETDIIQYVDTEANIATEVSLTILDLLCLYTLNHQVCFVVLYSVWSGAVWVLHWGKDPKGQAHRRLIMPETARSGNT